MPVMQHEVSSHGFFFFFPFLWPKGNFLKKATWSLIVGCKQAPISPAAAAKPLNLWLPEVINM